jgi:hypothetical protein
MGHALYLNELRKGLGNFIAEAEKTLKEKSETAMLGFIERLSETFGYNRSVLRVEMNCFLKSRAKSEPWGITLCRGKSSNNGRCKLPPQWHGYCKIHEKQYNSSAYSRRHMNTVVSVFENPDQDRELMLHSVQALLLDEEMTDDEVQTIYISTELMDYAKSLSIRCNWSLTDLNTELFEFIKAYTPPKPPRHKNCRGKCTKGKSKKRACPLPPLWHGFCKQHSGQYTTEIRHIDHHMAMVSSTLLEHHHDEDVEFLEGCPGCEGMPIGPPPAILDSFLQSGKVVFNPKFYCSWKVFEKALKKHAEESNRCLDTADYADDELKQRALRRSPKQSRCYPRNQGQKKMKGWWVEGCDLVDNIRSLQMYMCGVDLLV